MDVSSACPMRIDLSEEASRMLRLVQKTRLPDKPVFPEVDSSWGIQLEVLRELREEWLNTFDWEEEQAYLNKFNHYQADIEGLKIHFVHHKSDVQDSIPLLLLHGWPSSFIEYLPLIDELTSSASNSMGGRASFHVVVASLPGFAFSSPPPHGWTTKDTARVFNTLMTKVLAYSKFAVHGSDWGSSIAFQLYDNFSHSTRALHIITLPFAGPTKEQKEEWNITLTPSEKLQEDYASLWATTGFGYYVQHRTKPNTIGLALQDNPIGQLAWMAEKILAWSDPRKRTKPPMLNNHQILLTVTLYFVTGSFTSSVFIYAQNLDDFGSNYYKAKTDAPLLFSTFSYNPMFWPPGAVAKAGNLKLYRNHEFGGHFPGFDNLPALLGDLRDVTAYWDI